MKSLDESIRWCKRKRGIKLTDPNENLSDAYLMKSNTALKSMKVNMKNDILEWAIDAAYYARYYAIYKKI